MKIVFVALFLVVVFLIVRKMVKPVKITEGGITQLPKEEPKDDSEPKDK